MSRRKNSRKAVYQIRRRFDDDDAPPPAPERVVDHSFSGFRREPPHPWTFVCWGATEAEVMATLKRRCRATDLLAITVGGNFPTASNVKER